MKIKRRRRNLFRETRQIARGAVTPENQATAGRGFGEVARGSDYYRKREMYQKRNMYMRYGPLSRVLKERNEKAHKIVHGGGVMIERGGVALASTRRHVEAVGAAWRGDTLISAEARRNRVSQ